MPYSVPFLVYFRYNILNIIELNGWKGVAVGGGMALAGTFIPPFDIGSVMQFGSAIVLGGAVLTAKAVDPSDMIRGAVSLGQILLGLMVVLLPERGVPFKTSNKSVDTVGRFNFLIFVLP